MEQLSARLCTLCRTEIPTMQQTARRALSTSAASSSAASTSTSSRRSTANSHAATGSSEISTLVASLRYEVHRARPEPAQVWAKLNALRDASQAQSSQQSLPALPLSSSGSSSSTATTSAARRPFGIPPDLLAGAIPSLLAYDTRGVRPSKTRKASLALAALQDEAEALYARYRFLSSSLDESSAGPLPVDVLLEWAKAFERLGYAPAAWRLRKDGIASGVLPPASASGQGKAAGSVTDAKRVADAVLLASLQWLKLCRNVEAEKRQYQSKQKGKQLGSFDFMDRVAETLRETDAVLQYLTETNQQDALSRSLRIRIIKETSAFADTQRAIAATYGFDFEYPSESSCLKGGADAATPVMDRHTLNTILHMYAERGDLGKMMSVFEAVAYPIRRRKFPLHRLADQYSFFSANLAEQDGTDTERTEASSNGFFSSSTAIDSFAGSQAIGVQEEPAKGSSPITLHDHTPMSTASINTHTFILLIETATRLGCFGVARHYLAQMLNAWKQERVALRAAHQALEAWDEVPVATALRKANAHGTRTSADINEVMSAPLPSFTDLERIPTSHFGISGSAIFTVYKSLTQTGRLHANHSYLRALSAEVTDVLELLRQDVAYWARIVDKKRTLWQALNARAERAGEAGPETLDGSRAGSRTTFSSKLHLRLLKRTEIELDELAHRVALKVASLEEERTVAQLLRQLTSWQRLGDATLPIALQSAVTQGQHWVSEQTPLLQQRKGRYALPAAQVDADVSPGPLALHMLRGTAAERLQDEHEDKVAAARSKLASKVRKVEVAIEQAKSATAQLAKERGEAQIREAEALEQSPGAAARVSTAAEARAKLSGEHSGVSRRTSSSFDQPVVSGRSQEAEATVMAGGLSFT